MNDNKEIDDKKIKALIHSLGLKYGLQDDIINKVINSPYKFTRETISNMNLDDIETEEELEKLKTNFIYSYIGKIYVKFYFMLKIRQLKEMIKLRKNGRDNECE